MNTAEFKAEVVKRLLEGSKGLVEVASDRPEPGDGAGRAIFDYIETLWAGWAIG
jgi:hypothetical protein